MQYLYHVLSLREPVFIRPAELGGIQQVVFIKSSRRISDYHLKERIEEQNSKITLSGETVEKVSKQILG